MDGRSIRHAPRRTGKLHDGSLLERGVAIRGWMIRRVEHIGTITNRDYLPLYGGQSQNVDHQTAKIEHCQDKTVVRAAIINRLAEPDFSIAI